MLLKRSRHSVNTAMGNISTKCTNILCSGLQKFVRTYILCMQIISTAGHKYIHGGQVSLRLTEKISLCDYEMWETDSDGVIVSTNFINSSVIGNMTRKLRVSFPDDCENPKKQVENAISHEENVPLSLKEEDSDNPISHEESVPLNSKE